MTNVFESVASTPFDTLTMALRHPALPDRHPPAIGPVERVAVAAWMAVISETWRDASELANQAVALASTHGNDPMLPICRALVATVASLRHGAPVQHHLLDRVVEVITAPDCELLGPFLAMLEIPNWFTFADRFNDAGRIVDRQLFDARDRHDAASVIWLLGCRSELDLRRGRWQQADAGLREALALSHDGQISAGYLHVLSARLAAACGHHDDARAHLASARAAAFDLGDATTLWRIDAAEGFALLTVHDAHGAARALGHLASPPSEHGQALASVRQWDADLVEALMRKRCTSLAADLTEQLRCSPLETVWDRATYHRCAALVAVPAEVALDHASLSDTLFGSIGALFEQARSQLTVAELQIRLGRGADARAKLDRASSTFCALGAQPWQAHAQALARTDRSTLQRTNWHEELTVQERAVAMAVAAGSSNAQVACEHMISTKTVETHLTRIYRKLGVVSRTQLVAIIHRTTP